jgi:hypothetical protein
VIFIWPRLSKRQASNFNVSHSEPPSIFVEIDVCAGLILLFLGIFLDPVAEHHWVNERASALERVSSDTNTF